MIHHSSGKNNIIYYRERISSRARRFQLFSEKRSFHKSLSMFSVFGQGAFGRRNELEKLVQNELGDNENLMKEDLEALKRIAGGYNEFLNELDRGEDLAILFYSIRTAQVYLQSMEKYNLSNKTSIIMAYCISENVANFLTKFGIETRYALDTSDDAILQLISNEH